MPDVPVLVCACGMRLRAAGAVPGRVGRCPACGRLLRVGGTERAPAAQADVAPPAGTYGVAEGPALAPPRTFNDVPGREARSGPEAARTAIWNGFRRPPERPETRLWESLAYPLWGASGVALLVFLPPLFWLTSIPLLSILTAPAGAPLSLQAFGMLSLLPTGLGLVAATASRSRSSAESWSRAPWAR